MVMYAIALLVIVVVLRQLFRRFAWLSRQLRPDRHAPAALAPAALDVAAHGQRASSRGSSVLRTRPRVDDDVTDPAPPRHATLFSERLLGLHVHCDVSGCPEQAQSSGWLLRSGATWSIGFRCPIHGHDGGVWRREWAPLILDVVEDANVRGGGPDVAREPLTYHPPVAGMRAVRSYARDGCQAVLLTGAPPSGFIQIAHVLSVRGPEDPSRLLAIASEVSSLGLDGSHVLGLYAGHRHVNCGSSDEWADLVRFEERALALAAEHLQLHGAWRLLT